MANIWSITAAQYPIAMPYAERVVESLSSIAAEEGEASGISMAPERGV